ncbi:fibrinogen-like YCDxxxxGGGW domain-containing protein [Winogradskyella luteola]|uniref:Fibrinogen C-terminal domain-containing protein n=1 Tax=Winogradskyella luteola TaxID=2828330 RepID=A0A9X1F9H0_9FLAO|nr:fibrinogen-like YCDxxxxGGGW domain-containing protein [Winogradskyella luteola]MBV7269884.1 hypothetical protein [Winogradskyella luteola]
MKNYIFLLALFVIGGITAQVGVGTTTPDPSAALDIDVNNAGLLIPRLTTEQRNTIQNPADGLLIVNTTLEAFQYHYDGTWFTLSSSQDCGFANFPNSFDVFMDKGTSESIETRLQQTVGSPGNLTTALVFADAGFDISVNSITPNGATVAQAPNTTTQAITFTLDNSSTATVGDTGQAIFQIVSDCGEVAFVTVNINITGCEFSTIDNEGLVQYVTKPASGSVPVNFSFSMVQEGTNPGNVSMAYTTATLSGITEVGSPASVSYGGTINFDLDVPSTVNSGTYEYELTFTSDCAFTVAKNIQVIVEADPRDCKQIKTENPSATDGVYQIDPDGVGGLNPFDCYCDMTTDGGGWTMVMNYVQQGNPSWSTRNASLPLLNTESLTRLPNGDVDTSVNHNEGGSGTFWGHAGITIMGKFDFSEVRFYGESSMHTRILHFKHEQEEMVDYFKTGVGQVNIPDLRNNFSAFTDHTAGLPFLATNGQSNRGDLSMINGPFGNNNGGDRRQWQITNNYRMDSNGLNNALHTTIHRVWIR